MQNQYEQETLEQRHRLETDASKLVGTVPQLPTIHLSHRLGVIEKQVPFESRHLSNNADLVFQTYQLTSAIITLCTHMQVK